MHRIALRDCPGLNHPLLQKQLSRSRPTRLLTTHDAEDRMLSSRFFISILAIQSIVLGTASLRSASFPGTAPTHHTLGAADALGIIRNKVYRINMLMVSENISHYVENIGIMLHDIRSASEALYDHSPLPIPLQSCFLKSHSPVSKDRCVLNLIFLLHNRPDLLPNDIVHVSQKEMALALWWLSKMPRVSESALSTLLTKIVDGQHARFVDSVTFDATWSSNALLWLVRLRTARHGYDTTNTSRHAIISAACILIDKYFGKLKAYRLDQSSYLAKYGLILGQLHGALHYVDPADAQQIPTAPAQLDFDTRFPVDLCIHGQPSLQRQLWQMRSSIERRFPGTKMTELDILLADILAREKLISTDQPLGGI